MRINEIRHTCCYGNQGLPRFSENYNFAHDDFDQIMLLNQWDLMLDYKQGIPPQILVSVFDVIHLSLIIPAK